MVTRNRRTFGEEGRGLQARGERGFALKYGGGGGKGKKVEARRSRLELYL
jgi:hypothetical protein